MAFFSYVERYPLSCAPVFLIVLPLLLCLARYRSLNSAFRLLLIFLAVDLIIGLVMIQMAANHQNNLLLLNLFVPIRYGLLSAMFYEQFQSERYRHWVKYSIIGFIPFALLDIYVSNFNLADLHHHRVGKYAQVVESALLIVWALLYFYEIIKELKVTNIILYPFFWVCAGLLIFYSGNIFFFPFWHYMYQWDEKLELGFIEKVPAIVELISLFLFSIGIWQTRSHRESLES